MGLPLLEQNSLFEIQYHRSFYARLLHEGYCTMLAIDPSENGRIVGVATARDCDDELDLLTQVRQWWQGKRFGYIMTIGVHPSYRQRGLGAMLLQVRGFTAHHCCVVDHCLRSRRLRSESWGFFEQMDALEFNFIALPRTPAR